VKFEILTVSVKCKLKKPLHELCTEADSV